ncbi:hypothetical protein ACXDFG_02335 [Pediococcus pentosaceus]|uniref:hypothetical protein n=1 Tax=Pediococcus pentosaceus TaxID=1255 RepID=UPI003593BF65
MNNFYYLILNISKQDVIFIIDIISSLATAISAYLVFATLKEMKEQRNSSLRPILVLSAESENLFSKKQDTKVDYSFKGYIGNFYRPLELNLINIGVGPAKNIRYSFDKELLLNFLKLGANPDTKLKTKEGMITLAEKGIYVQVSIKEEHKTHLLSNNKEKIVILMSPIFIDMIERLVIREHFEDFSNNIFCINVKYEDIQGKQYNDKLRFSFVLQFAKRSKKENKLEEMALSIDIK